MVESPEPAEVSHVFPIDVEHPGIRLALPVMIVIGFIVGYLLTSSVLRIVNGDLAVGCFPVVGGIIFSLIASAAGDNLLKRIWPSGRSLSVDPDGMELRDRRKGKPPSLHIAWSQRVNALAWRFTVKRGSARIPKGWIMLGLQLLQDESMLTLYTFMPEKAATALHEYAAFQLLAPRAQLESNELPLREKIEQRRLHKAEDERWEDGAELRRQDFQLLLDVLTQRLPGWQERT